MFYRTVFVCGVAMILSSCGDVASTTKNELQDKIIVQNLVTMAVDDFKKDVDAGMGVVLDVRTAQEYDAGVIDKKAVNIDFYSDSFEQDLNTLDKSATYYVYCRSGSRSSKSLEIMRSQGFENVYELRGGISAWQSAGHPVL